jgi:dolichol-phosphate mannosyltransferase
VIVTGVEGVPVFAVNEFLPKRTRYCLCIPIINEGDRARRELERAKEAGIDTMADIIICDGGSTDGSMDETVLRTLGVNVLLIKQDSGRLSAQLRMGFYWCLSRGYQGIITVDGNDKDSIESVPLFIEKLDEGYDFVQGSRFINLGSSLNLPLLRLLAIRLVHAPLISLSARRRFTDTTNGFRGHSRRYLEHPGVQPFRNVFSTYEMLAYLSVRASQLGLRVCEVPVTRSYPKNGIIPTKISPVKGNIILMKILFNTIRGVYNP